MTRISTTIPTGRRLLTRASILAAVAVFAAIGTPRADDAGMILLPGIDIRSADFAVGRWCRYLVVDVAMGEADSSEVYVAVTGREGKAPDDAFWLDIESAPIRTAPADRDRFRVLIDGSVRSMADDDSLYRYIRTIYIKRGRDPVERGNPRDMERLTIVSPTSKSDWIVTPEVSLATPAGTFSCEQRRFETDATREVPAGRVKIVQRRVDRVGVWVTPGVPVFHLVKCEIERMRESRTVPPMRGIPESGPKESRTTSILVASGSGAKPLLSSP